MPAIGGQVPLCSEKDPGTSAKGLSTARLSAGSNQYRGQGYPT